MPYKGFAVVVSDGEGHPAANAKVTFRLPAKEPGGVFLTGAATEEALTDKAGRASVWGIRWGATPGTCQISIIALSEHASAGTIARVHLLAPGAAPQLKAQPAEEVVEQPASPEARRAGPQAQERAPEPAPPPSPRVKPTSKPYEPSFEVSPAPSKVEMPPNPPEATRPAEPAEAAQADKRPGVLFSRTQDATEHIPNPRMKWVWWTLGIAGAVGGGLAYRLTRNPQEAVQIPGDIIRPLSLGQPSISVGKP
ncbi:MAG: hypothetical protein IT167_25565 [Bryobacterales bacterium]|nr:hypothetical protein [Bryobacterales bacterium]